MKQTPTNTNIKSDPKVDADLNKMLKGNQLNHKKKAQSTKYQYTHVPLEIVEQNIDQFIIPELQKACKSLWERNIFTFMCSNREDNGAAYIILEPLNEVNMELFKSLQNEKPKNFVYDNYRRAYCIQIPDTKNMTIDEISDKFMQLTKLFIFQDVPKAFYSTEEEYLITCGCYKEIENPNYNPVATTDIKIESKADIKSIWEQIDLLSEQMLEPKSIKIYDPEIKTKPLIDYVKANGDEDRFDPVEQKVYISKYYLDKHNKYIQHKQSKTNAKTQ